MDLGPQAIGVGAAELKSEGFGTFKVKIGQQNHRNDIERVRAVRQAIGDEASIRVDGNGSYSFVDARSVLNELRQFRIADAEQPLARGDLSNLAELRRAVGIPIAAQESVTCAEDALRVLEERAADFKKRSKWLRSSERRGFRWSSAREAGARQFFPPLKCSFTAH
jgi:L-alanine-DL-glutamate epimerase-like enolase superfamily enzyme